MENEEYRAKLDKITRLCDEGDYEAAAAEADEIEWKGRNPQTLCVIAGIYNKIGNYEKQKTLLKTAYRRSSGSKRVLYHLVGCCAKTGDIEGAKKYLNEFEQIAPGDDSRFILRYKVQRAAGADLDECIRSLLMYKDSEYTERWAYELVKLYKENGQNDKCVAECDELFLWFGEGTYVRKALEVKSEIAELSPAQRRFVNDYDNHLIRLGDEDGDKDEKSSAPVEVILGSPKGDDESVVINDPASDDIVPEEDEDVINAVEGEEAEEETAVAADEEEEAPLDGTESSAEGEAEGDKDNTKGFSSRFMRTFKSAFSGMFDPVDEDEDEPKGASPAKEEASFADPSSFQRETDESLGLTREWSFTEELSKLKKKQEGGGKILTPEEEAVKTVAGAVGTAGAVIREAVPEVTLPGATAGAENNDELIAPADEEALRDLLKEDNSGEIPPEENSDNLMKLSSMQPVEEEHSILDEILAERDMVQVLPVEGRSLTDRERRIFSYFASVPGIDVQVTAALADIHNNTKDKTSTSGNVVIMGRQDSGKTRLARAIMLAAADDMGLKGIRMARVIGQYFNDKDPAEVVRAVAGGFLLIEGAGAMEPATVEKLEKAMSFRTDDLVVILEDEKDDMRKLLDAHPSFAAMFTSYITVPVFMNDELVSFAKTYAKERGYRLDEMATLALYGLIGANQKESEPVTVGKVKDMVDRAIRKYHKSPRFGKAVKGGGRILLREKDFDF